MRDINDLKNALGQADTDFQDNIRHTLARLQKDEESKTMRRVSLRLAVAIAIACLMITGTALALTNTWGVIDFLTGRREGVELLPDAVDIVQADIPQQGGALDKAIFSVREAVYDGRFLYIVVEAKPASQEYLLLGTDSMPSFPIGDMGPLFEGVGGTIADYAREKGKEMLRTWVGIDSHGTSGTYSVDFILEEDGALVYMLNCEYVSDDAGLDLALTCGIQPFILLDGQYKIDIPNEQRTPLSLTLENTGAKGSVSSAEPVIFADCGVRVDRVTLNGSAMAVYTEIEYTVIDQEKYAQTGGGLWFEFLDENGEPLPTGAASSGSVEALDEQETRFMQKRSIRAMETLPREIVLRGYNSWEKNRYEAHVLELR